MRSLTLKLTLAFLVVALAGAGLVALFIGRQTRQEFDRFVLNRLQRDLLTGLVNYYEDQGSWDGVDQAIRQRGRAFGGNYFRNQGSSGPAPVTLLDTERTIVLGNQEYVGRRASPEATTEALPLELDGQRIGWVIFGPQTGPQVNVPGSPELDFIRRMQWALILGALAATLVALLIGVLLARNISRPVRELTGATRRMALGELGVQVPVRTADELGELSDSFNVMSADLAHATQARRQLTADIAHDLRTPLTVILGYTEALSDGKLQGSPQMYEVMHKEAGHLSRMIDDLRTLSLADAGELTLNRQPVEPAAMLQRAVVAHQAQADAKEIDMRLQAEPSLPAVSVDPDRMAQVFNNLVSNALRHTPQGGAVTLSAVAADGAVLLRVRDTGHGIDPADLPHIFHRFYRGDRSRTQNGASGLGLAIARSIVEAHGGTIAADSPAGEGAVITIRLPVAQQIGPI